MNIKKIFLILLLGLIILTPFQTKAFLGFADFNFSFDGANFAQNTTSAGANASTAANTVKTVVKASFQKILAQLAARVALNMSQQIINWGATGFKGDPFYVRDMGSFMKSIADEQVTSFVTSVAGSSPFGQQLSQSLIQSYTTGSAPQFNLDQYVDDPTKFADDFTAGGWRGWLAINANPGNNPYGYTLESSRYLSNQINNAVQNQKTELGLNKGFLSMKKCVEYGTATTQDQTSDEDGTSVGDSADSSGLNSNEPSCLRYETTTPGSLIQEQLNKSLLAPLETAIQKNTQGGIGDALISLAAGVISQGINNLVGNAVSGGEDDGGPGSNNPFDTTTIGGTSNWNTGTGTVAVLEDASNPGHVSTEFQQSIDYTNAELDYLEQSEELLSTYPLKEQTLDICLPGPDYKYSTRLNETFQVVTRKLNTKADKDTNSGDDASDAIRRLTSDLDNELTYIKQALIADNIPSAPLILDRVNASKNQYQIYTQLQDKISSKIRVLAILNDIKFTVEEHPSTLVDGILTPPEGQDFENLQILYSSIEDQIGTTDSRNEAQGDYELYKKDDYRAFDLTNTDSLQSKCLHERSDHPEIDKLDSIAGQNMMLFCRFQNPVTVPAGTEITVDASNSGFLGLDDNSFKVFNPTNEPLSYPGDWTWDQEPFKNDKVDINCSDFYRSYLGDYSTDSFSN